MTDNTLRVSLFELLRTHFGESLRPLRCTKTTLVHLSHTLEDMVLTRRIPTILFTGFQESSHWREETARYRALAEIAQQVCIFAGGPLPPEALASELHVTLKGDDPLRQEWFLAVLSDRFAVVLCGQDRQEPAIDEARRQFDTLWTFEPDVINHVLDMLEGVVEHYRPERAAELHAARLRYPLISPDPDIVTALTSEMIRFEEDLHQRLALVSAQLDQQLQWREDLLAMLVHDMRSPLQVLSSTFSLLDMEGLLGPQERQELLRSAQKNANTLAEMVQMILDTNQLDRGELSLQMRPFQIGPWAKAIMENIHPLADAKGVILGLDISPQVSVLWADEGLLQRVVLNLLNNALKFTGKDGKVRLMIDPSLKSGHVELRVRDTGIGIRNEFLPRIFDRYTQVDKRDRRGAGLGLYFCRLVVEAHGGTIRAFSQSGAGTTMTVDLPLRPPFSITGMD